MKETTFSLKKTYIFFLKIYLICLPLGAMNLGSLGSALKVIAILPIGIALLSGGAFRFSKALTTQTLFTLFAFFSILWSISFENSLSRSISYALLLFLLISGTAFRYTPAETDQIKKALIWSSRITAVILLIFGEFIEGRFWLKSVIQEDPNYLCAYFSFGITGALGALAKKSAIWKKLLASAEFLLYFYLVLITGSRGGFLAITAATLAYLLTLDKKNKNTFKKIVILTLFFVAFTIILENLPEDLRTRFTIDNVVETKGTGRVDLWKQTLDLFKNSNILRQFFGFGTASIVQAFAKFGYHHLAFAHNIFLETLAELGIVGFALYTAAIVCFLRSAYRQSDKFAFSVMFGIMTLSFSTSIYTFKPYFNIMLYILILENPQTENPLLKVLKNRCKNGD